MAARSKKPVPPAPRDIVIVTWEDAWADGNGGADSIDGALSMYEPMIRRTLGYYVGRAEKNGRRCLMLATDDDRRNDVRDGIGGFIYTPIAMVLGVEIVRRHKS